MLLNTIRDELTQLDLPKLVMLKPRWGVSMAALIRKARDVGSISDYDYKQLNIALSTAGYRTNEPVPLHEEFPEARSTTPSASALTMESTSRSLPRRHS